MDVDLSVRSEDEKREAANIEASKMRKKAGLPELELDALPSSIGNKLLNLGTHFQADQLLQ